MRKHTHIHTHTHTHTLALCVRAAQPSQSRRASWHRRVVRMRIEGGGCGGADPRSCEAMPDSKMPIRREALESLSALTVYISRGGHIEGSSRLLPRGQSRLYTREGFLSFSRYFFSDGKQDLAAFADRFERVRRETGVLYTRSIDCRTLASFCEKTCGLQLEGRSVSSVNKPEEFHSNRTVICLAWAAIGAQLQVWFHNCSTGLHRLQAEKLTSACSYRHAIASP
jgi:hypothetical protein